MTKLISAGQVADLLGVSRQRVYELIRDGRLPEPVGLTMGGRVWDEAVIRDFDASWVRKPGRPIRKRY